MASVAYNSQIYVGGASTAFTGEAFTNVSGDIWQITSVAKRAWDYGTVPDFFDNGTPIVAGDIESIDYLSGTVTFSTTFVGPITADGDYIPLLTIAEGFQYSLDMSVDAPDDTAFGDTAHSVLPTLAMATGSLSVHDVPGTDLDPGGGTVTVGGIFTNKTLAYFAVKLTGDDDYFRCWGYITKLKTGASVADLVTSDIEFVTTLVADADGREVNFTIN